MQTSWLISEVTSSQCLSGCLSICLSLVSDLSRPEATGCGLLWSSVAVGRCRTSTTVSECGVIDGRALRVDCLSVW